MKNSIHIIRFILIIRYVKHHPYCKLKEIIEYLDFQFSERGFDQKLGLSERNIRRDFDEIRNTFGVSIDYNRRMEKGYYIPKNEVADSTVEDLLACVDILQIGLDTGLPEYIIPEKRRSRGTEHLMPIKKAITDSQIISFSYHKFYPDTIETKTVRPYLLKESRGRWYLLGLDEQLKPKSYGLDRIVQLDRTDRKFQRDGEIDWAEMYQNSFAMFTDAPVEEVVLSYDERDGNYIEAMPIHASQSITRQDDRVIVRLSIRITLDFIMELMSRSWSLKVIAPLHLKQRMQEIYKEAMERNG
jgi:predicted DNA-binding transcriptional regulator YafY